MALNPLGYIAEYESNFGANTVNPNSSARGIFQDLSATWQEASCAVGYCGTYATANDAPASVQAQANAWLFNQYGFQPWSSNQSLMNAVQAAGGTSAFNQPGQLATDANTYSALNSSGTSLQSFFDTPGVGTTASSSTGSSSGTSSGSSSTSTGSTAGSTSGTFRPYSWLWNQYNSALQQPLTNEIGYVQQEAGGVLNTLLVIDVAVCGVLLASGLYHGSDFFRKAWKAFIVVGLVGTAALYEPIFVQFWQALPTYLGQGLGLPGGATGPTANFDNVLATWSGMAHLAIINSPSIWAAEFWLTLLFIMVSGIVIITANSLIFIVWFVAQVIPQILLVIGPLLVLALLSSYTESIFFKYIHTLILMAAVAFVANILTVLALNVVIGIFNALPSATDGYAIALNLVGGSIAVAVLAFAIKSLPRILEHMSGGTGAPSMAGPQNALRRAVYQPAASGAGAAVGGTAGALAAWRTAGPAGRSLS